MVRPSSAISACSGTPGFKGGGEGVPQDMGRGVVVESGQAMPGQRLVTRGDRRHGGLARFQRTSVL
jgi:hypothetical protein